MYGSTLTLVNGLITDCGARVRQGIPNSGWFDVCTLREPYRLEGTLAVLCSKHPTLIAFSQGRRRWAMKL